MTVEEVNSPSLDQQVQRVKEIAEERVSAKTLRERLNLELDLLEEALRNTREVANKVPDLPIEKAQHVKITVKKVRRPWWRF